MLFFQHHQITVQPCIHITRKQLFHCTTISVSRKVRVFPIAFQNIIPALRNNINLIGILFFNFRRKKCTLPHAWVHFNHFCNTNKEKLHQ